MTVSKDLVRSGGASPERLEQDRAGVGSEAGGERCRGAEERPGQRPRPGAVVRGLARSCDLGKSAGASDQRSLLGLWLGDLARGRGRELRPAGGMVKAVHGTALSSLAFQDGNPLDGVP